MDPILKFKYRYIGFVLGLLIVLADASAATIRVAADRNTVHLNESFTLEFTADQSPDGEPDFTVLEKDFDILNQGQRSNISIINGKFSKSEIWTLSLIAKSSGSLVIPAVSFGHDQSPAVKIEVLESGDDDSAQYSDILLEVNAEPENPYVQAQVIYTVRFMRRVEVAQARLSEPTLENAVIQNLGDDRSFSALLNGEQYAVTERKFAIFPQDSGKLTIPALVLKAEVVTARHSGFFNPRSTRLQQVQSKEITLNVRPVPAEFKGKVWLPAEKVVFSEQWSNTALSVKVGEPLTRTLKLTASGAPIGVLPEFGPVQFDAGQGDRVKQYPDQPVVEEKKYYSGIIGSREQKVALIPSAPGRYPVRGVEIPWWNTRTEKMEVASLPGAVFNALAVAGGKTKTPDLLPDVSNSKGPEPTAVTTSQGLERESSEEIWFWIALFCATGWIATLIYIGKNKWSAQAAEDPLESREAISIRNAVRELKRACKTNDADLAKNNLMAWGRNCWPQEPPKNLGALADLCTGQLRIEIQNLSRILYGAKATAWNGTSFWEAFANYTDERTKRKGKTQPRGLEPLFKA